MLGLTTKDTNQPTFQFAGDRVAAKGIYDYFKSSGQVDEDLEVWLEGLSKNKAYQNKLYEFGKGQGWIDQDFNTWKNGLVGEQDQKSVTIFGENVDESTINNQNAAKSWSNNSNNIVSQINKLKENPILYTQADVDSGLVQPNQIGSVNVEATENKIKELSNGFPNILNFDNQKAASFYRNQELAKIDEKYVDLNAQKRRIEDGEYTKESDLERKLKTNFKNIKSLEDIRLNVRNLGVKGWQQNKDILKEIAENGGMKNPENFEAYFEEYNQDDGTDYHKKQRNKFLNNMIKNYEASNNEMGVLQGPTMAAKTYKEGVVEGGSVGSQYGKLGYEKSQVFYDHQARAELEQKLENHQSGKELMPSGELAQLTTVNPEALKYMKSLFPELTGDEVADEVFADVVNKATYADPRFQQIDKEIKNNLAPLIKDKYIELGKKYDTTTEKGLKLAQEEFQNWYSESYNKALGDNTEANKIFQDYGIAASAAGSELYTDLERNSDKDLAWIDSQLADATGDSLGDQWTRGTMNILEAGYKADTNIANMFNNIEVAMNNLSGTLERRSNVVEEIKFGLDNGLITKNTTLGEARKILNKGAANLDSHLRMNDWIWTDDDTIGDYLERKEERLANSEERVLEDIEQKIAYQEELAKFRQVEGGNFYSIEGVLNSIALGVDQAPQFVPKAIGYGLYGAGLVTGNPLLVLGGKGAIALGSITAGAQAYGSAFMESLENRMIDEYGEGGFTAQEYLDAMKRGLGRQAQGGALGAGITVGGVELLGDIAFDKLGGKLTNAVFSRPFMKEAAKNTLANFVIKNGARFLTLEAQGIKEGITEGFQSYLEQAFVNLGSGYDSPFTQNISFDQVLQEAKAGYQMGHLFGLAGVSGDVSGQYFANANRIAKNIDMSPDSSTFLAADSYFEELTNNIDKDKSLTADQKAEQKLAISDIRAASIKIPKTITGDTKSTLVDLLVEKAGLERKIKKTGDSDISANDIARKNAIGQEIQQIVDDANVELALDKNVGNVRKIIFDNSKGKITIDEVANAKEADAFAKSERLKGWNTKFSSNQGTILQDPNTGEQKIIINREQALKDQAVNVASHEFLHGLLFETVKNSPETAINMGNALDSELKKLKVNEDSKYYKRLEQYKDDPEAFTAEEKLTLFSDALAAGDIKFKENVFTSLGDNFRRTLQSVGLKGIKFNNGRDVFNFIKDYNNSIEKGELNMAQKKLLSEKAEGDLITDEVIDAKQTQKKSKPKKVKRKVDETLTPNQVLADMGRGPMKMFRDAKGNLVVDSGPIQPLSKDGKTLPRVRSSKADAKSLSELVKEYQEGNTDNAGEMFIQYEKVGKDALKRWAAERNVTINLGDPKVNKEVNSLLNSEFPSFAKNFKGDLSEATTYMGNIAKRIGTKIAAEGARKAKQVSTQALEEKGVSPKTTKQKDFDSASRKDTSRKKKYVSSIPAVKNEITENVAKDLVGEVDADGRATGLAKDIIGNIGRNTDPESVAKGIIAGTKDKSVMQTMRELVGKWGSPEYNSFVDNIINQGLIAAMPVATIKRRLGRQSNIDSGLINYKKIGKIDQIKVKDGKKTYSRPDVYSITKLDKEKLKEYYKETEKRQQSLFSMLTEGILAEGLQTLRNDKGFMDRLTTVLDLKKSPLTANEFMDGLEQKLDQRTKEDTSLDEVTVKSAKKNKITNFQEVSYNSRNLDIAARKDSQDFITEKGFKKLGTEQQFDRGKTPSQRHLRLTNKEKGIRDEYVKRNFKALGPNAITSNTFIDYRTGVFANMNEVYAAIGNGNINEGKKIVAAEEARYNKEAQKLVKTKESIKKFDEGKPVKQKRGIDIVYLNKDGKVIKSVLKTAQIEQKQYGKAPSKGGWDLATWDKNTDDPEWRELQEDKRKVLKNLALAAEADIKANLENVVGWEAFLSSQANKGTHPIRALAPIEFYTRIMHGAQVAEHTLPANQVSTMILEMAIKGNVNKDFDGSIGKNYMQGKITQAMDDAIDVIPEGQNKSLKVDMPNAFFNMLNPVTWIRYVEKSVNARKGGLNLNTIIVWDKDGNKQTLTESFGVGLTPSQYNMPNGKVNQNLIQEQNNFIFDMFVKGKPTAEVAKQRLTAKYNLNTQRTKTNIVAKNSKTFGDQIFDKEGTSTAQKQTMLNSLETRVLASKPNRKAKGISIFDFDDTLAKTKEKVIVTMSDGKVKQISAAQFAKTADILIEGGASFDFSNFEKVAKGTKKGPLADLALKRQGKFGSGDIFVLTARPQSAAPAIQEFLKSIGLDIPIENITGLSDGSAQAKVNFVLNKTAEGYNDFYFADDSIANVEGVRQVLDAIDVKSDTVIAKSSKANNLNKDFEKQIEEVTGVESFKKYSDVRAKLEGKKKDGGFLKRIGKQFTITSSAEDFLGLLYPIMGKGEQGNKHRQFIDDNLITPYNKAEQEVISATMGIARDFENLKKQFPNLKSKGLTNPLMDEIGVGPYTKSQAIRVYMWNKQGMEIPGMSKRDVNALVKAVESDNELNVFADEVMLIGKGDGYPAPSPNWLAGNVATDMMQELQKGVRTKLMSQFNENVDAIFTPETMNKLEAIYGSKWREAFEDTLRRMKSGSNRPVYTGGGSRLVNEMLDWLNKAVGTMMFFNVRSGSLQLISNVNFINWGDNNIYNASKAFASKDYWPTVVKLMNSDYLLNRRDGLKINVNEAELADAGKKGGFKGALSYLLDKGFLITRIMDSVAIATGGATFFINRQKALLNRTNPETGKKYTKAEAEVKAFDDFYAIAEETQQSSNPSKISQQQASLFGRTILSFQNVTMQYNRKAKKMLLDLINRRKRPGMTQLESDLSNVSGVMYYTTIQNVVFNAMQQALFALAFDDSTDDEEKEKSAQVINGMLDSLLFGLGFGGAIVSTVKNVGLKIFDESKRKTPDYEEAVWEVFNISPVIDSKVRKLRSAAKTFNWNMDKVKRRGWSLENPAYLAVAQVLSAGLNVPIDRVLQKYNNMAQAMDNETRTWQRIALLMGYSGWNFDLPYWGTQSHLLEEQAQIEEAKQDYKFEAKQLKKKGYKRIPLTGPKSGKPDGKLGVDYIEVERYDGVIEYWINLNR